nr:CNP1-like family protein [uncultured Rhodoferax sp.]
MILSIRYAAACALWLLSGVVYAQNSLDNPDWVEEKAPPAPTFSTSKLLPLEMPNFVTVKVGIDPDTINVGSDGIVRYVAVMTNTTGTSNAVYEGIRCLTGEVKTYARAGTSGTWSPVSNPVWRDLQENMGSQHARIFARQAACYARVVANKSDIIKALQTGRRPGSQKNDNQG